MSATLRAFYGALVGALVVLLVHPYSRPYLLQGVWFLGDSPFLRRTNMLPENLDTLPEPKTPEDAGLWVTTASTRDMSGRKLSQDELLLVLEVVQAAAEQDPDNAFWRQAEAVFLWKRGNDAEARDAWETAALASRWSDYQNSRLQAVLEGLSQESGHTLGWHNALVDSRKSFVVPRTILSFARNSLRGDSATDFDLRLATLRNCKLLRDGSRTVDGAAMGMDTVDLAAYAPVPRVGLVSPRELSAARDSFLNEVRARSPEVEEEVKQAFRENDARVAFISPGESFFQKRVLAFVAVTAATLPGALVTIGLIGAGLYLLGWAFSRSRTLQRVLTPPWTQVLGIAAGLGVYLTTELFFPALWAAVSLVSFGVRRDDERQALPGGLGKGYGVSIAVLAIGFSLLLALYFVAKSVPGEYVLEESGVASGPVVNEFALLSLAAVIASLALVSASVWGFLSRIPAERLAGPSIAKFGATVCLGCFAVGVILVPVSIAVDRTAGETLSRIFQNEPTYYLTR
jgi:hypothetical protein